MTSIAYIQSSLKAISSSSLAVVAPGSVLNTPAVMPLKASMSSFVSSLNFFDRGGRSFAWREEDTEKARRACEEPADVRSICRRGSGREERAAEVDDREEKDRPRVRPIGRTAANGCDMAT